MIERDLRHRQTVCATGNKRRKTDNRAHTKNGCRSTHIKHLNKDKGAERESEGGRRRGGAGCLNISLPSYTATASDCRLHSFHCSARRKLLISILSVCANIKPTTILVYLFNISIRTRATVSLYVSLLRVIYFQSEFMYRFSVDTKQNTHQYCFPSRWNVCYTRMLLQV